MKIKKFSRLPINEDRHKWWHNLVFWKQHLICKTNYDSDGRKTSISNLRTCEVCGFERNYGKRYEYELAGEL